MVGSSGSHESHQPVHGLAWIFGLTFPNCEDLPTKASQMTSRLYIPFSVLLDLLFPEVSVACWQLALPATAVTMPEATIHKDDLAMTGEYNVRLAR